MNESITYRTEKTLFEDEAIKLADDAVSLYKKAGYEVERMNKDVLFDNISFTIVFKKRGKKK